jgi:nanoRNase/pAp phosphatase (c-di-AMP/oligoRNAs hydrolase)
MKHQEVIEKICDLWNASNRIVLTGASNFDGDALGCVYALAEFGKSKGKEMFILNEKPVTRLYAFLESPAPVLQVFPKDQVDMIIVCDTGSLHMLGTVYSENREIFDTVPTVNIDHHNSCYGNVCWSTCSYENTSATMMIDCFIRLLDPEGVTPTIATYLLLGLYFDTECYRNLNTTPH